ncbi:MAG TPA: DNA repair protein RadA [Candidatus Hydrogenedentes bacterium]|nr:DNA repair protein RadA [Candidatus Hydrogenedentota bacterium]
MAKTKSTFVCQKCGATYMRWVGRCTDCGQWNTVIEEPFVEAGKHVRTTISDGGKPIPVTEQGREPPARISTGILECDRVLGGGIVAGSLTLVGGDPGIGKSTIMLQVSHGLATEGQPVLYVSGEESFSQSQLRARRLGTLSDNLLMLTETELTAISKYVLEGAYSLVVVDSIQSVYSAESPGVPGSISQVRDCASEFLRLAKKSGTPVFLVGHVTKDGSIAGPRMLEHLVDTVLYFEGEGKQALRILRAVKNRFGSTNEIGVFEMTETGLQEVPNPSALFLNERPEGVSGSIVLPSVEGTRPLLVEVQALVCGSNLGSPRRTVTGVNPNRVSLILAVLEKRAGLHFADRDVFVNVAGGVRLDEPAADLAIALALVSSFMEAPAAPHLTAFGEIGLAGEVRGVDMVRQRVSEASKFGFTTCILPKSSAQDAEDARTTVWPVGRVSQAIEIAMER